MPGAEPFMLLNLILVRVEGMSNSSQSNSAAIPPTANARVTPDVGAPPITSGTGVEVATGDFVGAATAAIHNDAFITLYGGRGDGRRGLDRVYAGWVNNELDANTPTRPNPSGEDVVSV
jgi:hypothetical protein